MPTASALFASVAPASAGTNTAAPGIQDEDAGLFSIKIAELLQAAPADTGAQPPAANYSLIKAVTAVMQTQVEQSDTDANANADADADADAALVLTPPLQPAVTTPAPVQVATNTNTATDDAQPAMVVEEVQVIVEAQPLSFVAVTPPPPAATPAPAPVEVAAKPAVPAHPAAQTLVATTTDDVSEAAAVTGKPAAAVPLDKIANLLNASAEDTEILPALIKAAADALSASKTTPAAPTQSAAVQTAVPQPAATQTPAPVVPNAPVAQAAAEPAQPAQPAQIAAAPKGSGVPAPASKDDAATIEQKIAETLAAAAKGDIGKVELKVAASVPARASADAASSAPVIAAVARNAGLDKPAVDATELTQPPASDTEADTQANTQPAAPAANPAKPLRHNDQPTPRNTALNDGDTPVTGETSNIQKTVMADAAPTPFVASAHIAAAAEAAAPAPVAAPATQPATPAALEAQQVQQAAVAERNLGLSNLSHATIETTTHLAAQIARKLDGKSTRFDMVLTPEDLGRVDVSLEIGEDGQLAARLAFDNPAAAAELRGRADELRKQLQDAGFQVAGDALDFSQRDQSAGGNAFERQQQRNALFSGGSRLALEADAPSIPAPGAWINLAQTPDRVDVKV